MASAELLAGVAVPALTLMPGIVVKIPSMCIKSRYTALAKFGDDHKEFGGQRFALQSNCTYTYVNHNCLE